MTSILDIFSPQVSQSGDTITVTYCHQNYSGTCIYKEATLQGSTKRFKQKVNVLINTDMGDVIEYLYKKDLITDIEQVRYEIQTHSRKQIEG